VVNDIDIHQLSLGPIKSLKFLVKSIQKICFVALLEQQKHKKLFFLEKVITFIKQKRIS
jgi:hypothetical protein